jgi:hypothetical protein
MALELGEMKMGSGMKKCEGEVPDGIDAQMFRMFFEEECAEGLVALRYEGARVSLDWE